MPSGLHAKSYLEESFATWLNQYDDMPSHVREFHFAPPRRWRLDFAWPSHKVAVEIEGVTYDGGRHQRPQGFLADAEKYESAMLHGWTVYRVPGPWIATGRRSVWRPQVMNALRAMLGMH